MVLAPQDGATPWRVRLRDLSTGNKLPETTLKQGFINSSKRWFVRFRIEVWEGEQTVFTDDYDARGRKAMAPNRSRRVAEDTGGAACGSGAR